MKSLREAAADAAAKLGGKRRPTTTDLMIRVTRAFANSRSGCVGNAPTEEQILDIIRTWAKEADR